MVYFDYIFWPIHGTVFVFVMPVPQVKQFQTTSLRTKLRLWPWPFGVAMVFLKHILFIFYFSLFRETGKPYHNFITWQDLRASDYVKSWNNSLSLKVTVACWFLWHLPTLVLINWSIILDLPVNLPFFISHKKTT